MKSTILTTALAALLCTSATTSNAQLGVAKKVLPEVNLGVKVGANMQQTSLEKAYKGGFLGGVFVGVSKKKLGIRVEGLIKSAKLEYAVGNPIKTIGLDIPLLFQYAPIKRLKLHIGPQYSMLLSAKEKDVNVKDVLLKSSDICLAAGFDVFLPLKLTLGARYIKGLTDISVANTNKITSSTFQVSVGYRFLN